jgi:hypothetical protein
MLLGQENIAIALRAGYVDFFSGFADFFLTGGKVNMTCLAEEPNPVYFFM